MSNTDKKPLIRNVEAIENRLPGLDPFIFGAYHQDNYPQGNGRLAPDSAVLKGRDIGMDFSGKEGWSMYHGDEVPGFPAHPHRGFETVTIVRKGLVDHADSLRATARYGEGDVQWLTTGRGVQHGEMFPLVHQDKRNLLDLFQIWLNLPAKSKTADPDFTMFWASDIPRFVSTDAQGRRSEVEVIAGDYSPVADSGDATGALKALPPPKNSWASDPRADLAIWIVRLDPGAALTLPAAKAESRRALYLTQGTALRVGDSRFDQRVMIETSPEQPVPLFNESSEVIEILLLQGRPIGEPIAAYGPFVMNTHLEIAEAMEDFQRTQFGGWPWPSRAHTLGDSPRFAQHPDGRIEYPKT